MQKKMATIILNRNLPNITEDLLNNLKSSSLEFSDFYIVESGSDEDKLSADYTWWANWPDSLEHGLRVPRGFNFALSKLLEENKYNKYDYFLLLPNDTEFETENALSILLGEMESHPKLGILSPCSKQWGELSFIGEDETKYFWYIDHMAWLVRRDFIDSIRELEEPNHLNFLFDGTNFRGYESNIEVIVKGYANDWATAITSKVFAKENEEHLFTKSELIKTDPFEDNLKKYIEEGKKWLRRKYGFNSRWNMYQYSKFMYDNFFEFYPETENFKI
jgi:hypothetical protein